MLFRYLAPLILCIFSMATAIAGPPKESELQSTQAKRLTTDEIHALHAGRTVYHLNVITGVRVPIWYANDGTRSYRAGQRQFKGEWAARNDSRCEETGAGPVVCMTVYQQGDEWVACDPREAPECRWRIEKSVPGDAERLGK
jgi:hypothetical protein